MKFRYSEFFQNLTFLNFLLRVLIVQFCFIIASFLNKKLVLLMKKPKLFVVVNNT